MKKTISIFSVFLLLAAGCVSTHKNNTALRLDSGSKYQIVLPDRWNNPGLSGYCRQAAEMLRRAIKEGVGADVPIVTESQKQNAVKGIFLGNTQALKKLGEDISGMAEFEYLLREDNGNIYIAGIDRHYMNDRSKWDKRSIQNTLISGTINGVVNFAEKYLGVRFFNPGAPGTDYLKNIAAFSIPRGLNFRSRPRYVFSHTGFAATPDPLYDYANQIFGRGRFQHWGGHSHNAAIPAEMFKTHPEYFILRDGKRICGAQRHYCLSNPQVEELIYQLAVKYFRQGIETVSMGADDSYMACECRNCAAIHSDPGERLWIFHRKLAERLQKEWPGKKYLLIAYGPTRNPPKTFKKFLPNMMVELAYYSAKDLENWRRYDVPGGFTAYIYNWGAYNLPGFTPKRTPEFVMKQLKTFDDFGIKGMFRCGWGENRGLEGPVYYLFGKRIADPGVDAKQILEEYYERYYKECAIPMKRFHKNLFRRLRLIADLQYHQDLSPVTDPKALLAGVYTPDLLQMLERDLHTAEKQAVSAKVKQRIKLVRTEFDYVRNLALTIIHFNSYLAEPDWKAFDRLEKSVNRHLAAVDQLCDKRGFTKEDPAWPEIKLFQCRGGYLRPGDGKKLLRRNGSLGAVIEAPLNWNFKLLRSQKVLPGALRKKCFAVRGTPGTDWERAKWNELSGIQLGPVREKSRFKILYDSKNIYFLMQSELRDPNRDYEKTRGKGGTDSMEIFLDPTGSRELFYHFHFNPVSRSCIEGAFGLCKDPLDPRFKRYDMSWSCKWDYKPAVRNGIWETLVTIPFSSIGSGMPVRGSIWLLNVGHTSYDVPGNWHSVELSLWSPNLESSGNFHDINTLGELEFK